MACAEPESSNLNLEYPGGTSPYLETLFAGKLYDVKGYNNLGTHRSVGDGREMTNGLINLTYGNNPEFVATPQIGRDILLQHNTWILRPGGADSATYEGLYFPYTGTNGMTWAGWTNNNASSTWNAWMLDNVTTCPPGGDNGGQGFNAAGLYSYMGCPTDSGLVNASCQPTGATNVYSRYKGNVMAVQSSCQFHTAENWTLGGSTNYGVPGTTFGFANSLGYNSLVSPGDLTLTSPAYGATSGNNNYTTSDGTTSGVNMTVLNAAIYTALTGVPAGGGLVITTTSLPNGSNGVLYDQFVTASGNTGSITWSLTVGSLPSGLGSINSSTGEITGTPTGSGTSNFTVRACDSLTCVTKALSITISAPPLQIVTAPPLPSCTAGVFCTTTIVASGGVAPLTYAVIACFGLGCSGGQIPGLSMGASTGIYSGTATVPGVYDISIRVTDSTLPTHQSVTVPFPATVISFPFSGFSNQIGGGTKIGGRSSWN